MQWLAEISCQSEDIQAQLKIGENECRQEVKI
jgi:hypothetical protein